MIRFVFGAVPWLLVFSLWVVHCGNRADGGADHERDAASDGDADSDVDADSDGDADGDVDADSDIDTDADEDVDGDHGGDTDIDAFVPYRCEVVEPSACGTVSHSLPIPTHFSSQTGGFEYLSADAPPGMAPDPLAGYVPGGCFSVYSSGFIPDTDHYYGDVFALEAIADDRASLWASQACEETGVPIQHLWPPAPDGAWHGPEPASDTCVVQVIHAGFANSSLFTVFLPPNWSAQAPAGTYAIVLAGFYDIHTTTFGDRSYGTHLVRVVARSGLDGGRGVIGVTWNGGGAGSSLTCNEGAHHAFGTLVDEVVQRYGGNREWIVTFGGSRGGYTALSMASNPYQQSHRVVLAAASVPPAFMGELFQNAGTTYPGFMTVVGNGTGLADAWRAAFRYPTCAGRPHLDTMAGWQAALRVICGTADPTTADDWNSPGSERGLAGLAQAGTQVYAELGEHDLFIPFSQQNRLYDGLLRHGVPTAARVMVRGGHNCLATTGDLLDCDLLRVVSAAAEQLADPALDLSGPVPQLVEPGLVAYRVDRASQALERLSLPDGQIPFSLEVPAMIFPGHTAVVSTTGKAGTEYNLEVSFEGAEPQVYTGMIRDQELGETFRIDIPADHPPGDFLWGLEIRKPGGQWVRIPATNTPTGAPCTSTVLDEEPILGHTDAALAAQAPALEAFPLTSWGLSEY